MSEACRDFDALSAAIRWLPHTLRFYAFDILHLDGEDLRDRPLLEHEMSAGGLVAGLFLLTAFALAVVALLAFLAITA